MAAPRPNDTQDGRSRNARAQARHREKRKAYIAQLEDTVTRLQATVAAVGTDPSAPSAAAHARLRELEQENYSLRIENAELRRHMAEGVGNVVVGSGQSPISNSSGEFMSAYERDVAGPSPTQTSPYDFSIRNKRKRPMTTDDPPSAFAPELQTSLDTPSSRSGSLSRPASQPMGYHPSLPRPPSPVSPIYNAIPSNSAYRSISTTYPTYPQHRQAYPESSNAASTSRFHGSSYSVPGLTRPAGSHHQAQEPTLHLQTSFAQQPMPSYTQSATSAGGHNAYLKQEDDEQGYTPLLRTPALYTPSSATSAQSNYTFLYPSSNTHLQSNWNPNPYPSERGENSGQN